RSDDPAVLRMWWTTTSGPIASRSVRKNASWLPCLSARCQGGLTTRTGSRSTRPRWFLDRLLRQLVQLGIEPVVGEDRLAEARRDLFFGPHRVDLVARLERLRPAVPPRQHVQVLREAVLDADQVDALDHVAQPLAPEIGIRRRAGRVGELRRVVERRK